MREGVHDKGNFQLIQTNFNRYKKLNQKKEIQTSKSEDLPYR